MEYVNGRKTLPVEAVQSVLARALDVAGLGKCRCPSMRIGPVSISRVRFIPQDGLRCSTQAIDRNANGADGYHCGYDSQGG